MTTPNPLISIIVPVKNGAKTIAKCLNSIRDLAYGNWECIVIDDGSADATLELMRGVADPRIKIVAGPGGGPSKARNDALKAARGEYIVFTDADCIVDRNWLEELQRCFTEPAVAGAGGIQLSPDDDSAFGKKIHDFMAKVGFVADYMKDPSAVAGGITATEHNPSCNAMYRASVLRQAGGFQEGLWPGEDVELDYRVRAAGGRLVFNPGAVVYHYRPGTLRAFWRMMFNYGRVQAFLVRRYGRFRRIQSMPAVFAAAIVLTAVAGLLKPWSLSLIFGSILTGLWVFFICRRVSPFRAAAYVALGIAALVGWNLGYLKGRLSELPGSMRI